MLPTCGDQQNHCVVHCKLQTAYLIVCRWMHQLRRVTLGQIRPQSHPSAYLLKQTTLSAGLACNGGMYIVGGLLCQRKIPETKGWHSISHDSAGGPTCWPVAMPLLTDGSLAVIHARNATVFATLQAPVANVPDNEVERDFIWTTRLK